MLIGGGVKTQATVPCGHVWQVLAVFPVSCTQMVPPGLAAQTHRMPEPPQVWPTVHV